MIHIEYDSISVEHVYNIYSVLLHFNKIPIRKRRPTKDVKINTKQLLKN